MRLRKKLKILAASLALSMGLASDVQTYYYPTFPYGKTHLSDVERKDSIKETVERTHYNTYISALDEKWSEVAGLYGKTKHEFSLELDPLMALIMYHGEMDGPLSLVVYDKKKGLFNRILGLVANGRSFVFDDAMHIERRNLRLSTILHESGHLADPYYSLYPYLSDEWHELRAEFIADSFKCAIGEILARDYLNDEGRIIFSNCIANSTTSLDGKTVENIFETTDDLTTARMMAILMSSEQFKDFKEIYLFSKELDQDSFFYYVKAIMSLDEPVTLFNKGKSMLEDQQKELCLKIQSEFCRDLLKPR